MRSVDWSPLDFSRLAAPRGVLGDVVSHPPSPPPQRGTGGPGGQTAREAGIGRGRGQDGGAHGAALRGGRLPVSPQGPLRVPSAMWRGRCRRLLLGCAPRPAPGVPKGTGGGRGYAPPAERKRFYQNVSISQGEAPSPLPPRGCLSFLSACSSLIPQDFCSDSPGGFEINLDHRKLKTPQAKLFTVPSEALAIAVATEWDSQKDTIKFYTMHLTTLCNTALDNPTQRSKGQLIRAAVKFLETDTVCSYHGVGKGPGVCGGLVFLPDTQRGFAVPCPSYRVEEPAALAELQKNEWDPIVAWAEKRYNVAIGSSTSIMGPNIPASTRDTFSSHLASYNMWALQGIEYVITQLKSLILSMGLIDRHITVEKAVLLSRLEEEYQIQRWGKVEWAHDYDLCELRARAAAGTLFVHLCSESSTVKHKLLQD
ncbi:ATP synthase mitochondrial F1 complex assembly factor 2 [Aix galericulata]|nr:ATP synthase mitochondrial F1 complex assembly factor 2 [Aix galericulata]